MNKANNPKQISLFVLDSAVSNYAVTSFIKSHHKRIGLVIASNPFRKKQGSSIQQFFNHYRHSGMEFSLYLAYCFFLFPLLLEFNAILYKLFGIKNHDISIKQVCAEYEIKYDRTDDINNKDTFKLLDLCQIDLIVVCFFDQILGDRIIQLPDKTYLNIHPGLLPDCRGVFPEFHTAAGKCLNFGITIHRIEDSSIDSGRILLTRNILMEQNNSMLMIGRKLLKEGLAALEEILDDMDSFLGNASSQGDGNYYSYPLKEDIRKIKKAGFKLL